MQSRFGSFVEAWANVVAGIVINYFANIVILRGLGFEISYFEGAQITAIFTAISVARSYLLRRWFNGMRRFYAGR